MRSELSLRAFLFSHLLYLLTPLPVRRVVCGSAPRYVSDGLPASAFILAVQLPAKVSDGLYYSFYFVIFPAYSHVVLFHIGQLIFTIFFAAQ